MSAIERRPPGGSHCPSSGETRRNADRKFVPFHVGKRNASSVICSNKSRSSAGFFKAWFL
jgi:hypothetical protein